MLTSPRRIGRRFALLLAAAMSVVPAFAANHSAPRTTVYVAPEGNDANQGTAASPLATLQKARAVAREMKNKARGPIDVLLLPGTYYLGESLVFGPDDSGSELAPITYRAVKEGSVILSGGARLTCAWRPYKNGIFVCDLPQAKAGNLKFSELFVNGRRQIRARYPNGDSRQPQPAGYLRARGADPWPHKELYYDPASFTKKQWAHPEDAVVFCFQRICFDKVPFWNGQWRVRGLDRARHALLLGEGGHQQLLFHYMQVYKPGIYPNMPFYVENVLEELDAPGEWFLDPREGKLYYMPAAGVDLKIAVVEPALYQRVIQFRGTKALPVHHITFCGLWIAHAASTYFEPYGPAGMGDYTIHRGGAVFVEGAEDIALRRCSLEGNSGNGFYVNGYARRVKLSDSRVVDIGESGICFTGKDNYRPDKSYKCPVCGFPHWWGWDQLSADDIPMDCEASDNLVHDVGVLAKQCGGVFLANSQRIRVLHNHIYNTPRAGINVNNGAYGGHLFAQNDVHDTVRETSDHGPFNSYGRDRYWCQHVNHPGFVLQGQPPHHGSSHHSFGPREVILKDAKETSVICQNRFAATRLGGNPRPGVQFGIDLDDGSSNYDVYGNLGVGMSLKTLCSLDCKVHDNVFVRAGDLQMAEPFDGRLEVKNNRFIPDLTPEEAESRFFQGVRFGVTDEFPAWLKDRSE
jgi:hypothetical protein